MKKTLKNRFVPFFAVIIALFFGGCKTGSDDPESADPGPGPGKITGEAIQETEGFGVPDPEFMAKYPYFVFPNLGADELLTEAKLKQFPPSYWNSQTTEAGRGHIHAYPDPFHFANGNRVVNLKDWENRRKELQLLVSYYGKGHIPSIDSSVVDIWLTGDNNTTINIRHRASGRTESFTITVTDDPALTVAGNEGKLYASCDGGSGNTEALTLGTSGYVVSSGWDTTLAVDRTKLAALYGTGTSANNITRDSATAWCAGVLLAAIEGTDDPVEADGPRQAEKQYFYATSLVGTPNPALPDQSWFTTKGPLYSSGYSTLGKQAAAHIMGLGRSGASRFGHADIGDSGAGGAAIERFNAVAGFRLDITIGEALAYSGYTREDVEALGLDPDLKNPVTDRSGKPYGWPVPIAPKKHIGAITRAAQGSLGGPQDMWGTPYYTYGLQAGRSWPMGGGMPDIANTGKGNLRMVRGWAPYWEEFDRVPNVNNSFDVEPTDNWLKAKVPYAPYKHTATQSFGGIQQWMQGRNEDKDNRNWFGDVWRQFTDLHNGLTLDNSSEGFGCAMPFDTYYETILNAPYGSTFIRAGVEQTRTNQPSMWANWLIIDEVYKMYGEMEYAEEFNNGILAEDPRYPGSGLKMGWDKYVWRNVNFFNWGSHGGNTAEESATSAAIRDLVRSGRATTQEAMSNVTLAKCRDPAFPVDDPVYYLSEYCKMDWGRPGSPTIAERVRRRVEPILKDYFMGEIYHDVPAPAQASDNTALLQAERAASYHDEAQANYRPSGPRFKRMDWRGLLDNPELE